MLRFSKMYYLALGLSLLFTGCNFFPEQDIEFGDQDVIITHMVPGTDFGQYQTYTMPDIVLIVKGRDRYDTLDVQNTSVLLSTLANIMQERGFVKVDRDANPDLGLNVAINRFEGLSAVTTPVYMGPGYWGWWGWNPMWYAPVFVTSFVPYEDGTVIMDMVDIKSSNVGGITIPGQNDLKLIWNAWLRGLLVDSENFQNRLTFSVQQAFDQTPGLRRN
ncbi:MAG: DUF4136 domain-containing protein [Cyclobacteriaceae bacterium]|nr:DUF4136 domain-containing protein [Cyclobacteriaceae bacterium]